jgi:nucleoside-diphosphate-sugar epimerase
MASIAFSQLAKELKLNLKILRIFQVYGEGEADNRLWPSLRKAAKSGDNFSMTAGEQVRDFVSVENVAERFVMSCIGEWNDSKTVNIQNIGTGKPMTTRSFAEYWWQKWGAEGKLKIGKIDYRKGEIMRYVPKCL